MTTTHRQRFLVHAGLLGLVLGVALPARAMIEKKIPLQPKPPIKKRIAIKTKAYLQFNQVFASGSADDWRVDNQYPLASSHNTLGLGMAAFVGDTWNVGLESHATFLGRYTLTDPKDGDTIRLSTRLQVQAFLVFGYRLLGKSKTTVHVQLGAGVAWLPSDLPRTIMSSMGNEVTVSYPAQLGFACFAGLESSFSLGGRSRLLCSPRYCIAALAPYRSAVSILLGLGF